VLQGGSVCLRAMRNYCCRSEGDERRGVQAIGGYTPHAGAAFVSRADHYFIISFCLWVCVVGCLFPISASDKSYKMVVDGTRAWIGTHRDDRRLSRLPIAFNSDKRLPYDSGFTNPADATAATVLEGSPPRFLRVPPPSLFDTPTAEKRDGDHREHARVSIRRWSRGYTW
jgi:hypothetical protein